MTGLHWLREQDLNLRPSGYEPDELPGCSIPRFWMGRLVTLHLAFGKDFLNVRILLRSLQYPLLEKSPPPRDVYFSSLAIISVLV